MSDLVPGMLERLQLFLQHKEVVGSSRQQLEQFRDTLTIVQAVLADAEMKQLTFSFVRKLWLEELKNVVYDAEDMVGQWNTKILISQQKTSKIRVGGKVLSLLLYPCSSVQVVMHHFDISRGIEVIRDRLEELSSKRSQFGFMEYPSTQISQERYIGRMTHSVIDESRVHGRTGDVEVVMSWLLGESSGSHQDVPFQVISIVGMGGIGKTALAQTVLCHERKRLEDVFEEIMWVCVSQTFDPIQIAKAITEQLNGNVSESIEHFDLDSVQRQLSNSVKGKRFMLVLDDVWNEDPFFSNNLKIYFYGAAPGSRILVTTRNETVSRMMGSSHVHKLKILSDYDSWLILRDIALAGRGNELVPFEAIGEEIAIKCKGVPLIIRAVGSLLRLKDDTYWRNVLECDFWELDEVKEILAPCLLLSYHSLPSVTKQCFVYCAIFLQDTRLNKDDLVRLWIAQRLFGSEENGNLEQIGEGHFRILCACSFFTDVGHDTNGNIITCKMHYFVHGFTRYLAAREYFIMRTNETCFDCASIRHLCATNLENPSIYEAKNLRTLMVRSIGRKEPTVIPVDLFNKLAFLRTLDLSDMGINVLPLKVEKLFNLRYLDLSHTDLLELPETVCNVYHLQTMKLNGCKRLLKLPEEIGNLSHLRHLEIMGTDALSYLPPSISALSSLQTLSKFIVGGAGSYVGCNIGDLKLLTNVQGSLELKGLSRIDDRKEAGKAELDKKKIRALIFNFEVLEGRKVGRRMEGILEVLEPHADLDDLNISHFPGSQFPYWVQSSSILANIVNIKLYKCGHCTKLPAFGKLPRLENLEMDGLSSLRYIGHEFYGLLPGRSCTGDQMMAFPMLKKLVVKNMETWKEWNLPISNDTKIMSLLSELTLDECPVLNALPCLGMLESLEFLDIGNLSSVKRFARESLEVLPKIDDGEHSEGIFFSFLKWVGLEFILFPWKRNLNDEETAEDHMFPKLKSLSLKGMKALQQWEEPFLPQFLEKLILEGDVGVFSESLPVKNDSSVTSFSIIESSSLSLPKGFEKLNTVERMKITQCHTLDFALEELQGFTRLRYLEINDCPILKERFHGEEWRSIFAVVPQVIVDDLDLTSTS